MFKQLKNQALVTFKLATDGPLSIRSGNVTVLDPTVPDMQVVRTHSGGKSVPYMPGSSIKGVMRARAEKIITLLGGDVCDIFGEDSCGAKHDGLKKDHASGQTRYYTVCPACRLFGCTVLGGRVAFADAMPVGDVKLGVRNGVGINRITGGSYGRALYDFEVVEDATFAASFTLTNYALWQLKLMMFILHDIDDGYVAFGSATTRGNGRMKVKDVRLQVRDFRQDIDPSYIAGYQDNDKITVQPAMNRAGYYWELDVNGLDAIDNLLRDIDVKAGIDEEARHGNHAQ